MALRWMTFVDGENLTIRGQNFAKSQGIDLIQGELWRPNEFLWLPRWYQQAWRQPPQPQHPTAGQDVFRYIGSAEVALEQQGTRATYYTALKRGEPELTAMKELIWKIGFNPAVFKKTGEKSKGVDITLTRDMLTHAFRDNFDVAILMTGDADFIPVVEELKRLGKRVHISFFPEGHGLSPALRRSADSFGGTTFVQHFVGAWREYSDWIKRGSPIA